MRRTTIEIDEDLLARAKRALGLHTTRATVDEALRRAARDAEANHAARAERQLKFLGGLDDWTDPEALGSEEMWR